MLVIDASALVDALLAPGSQQPTCTPRS